MPEPIRPVYKLWNAAEGHWQWGLLKDDYMRVQNGYACGYCLEPFNHWVPVCYLCGEPNTPAPETPVPREWIKQAE